LRSKNYLALLKQLCLLTAEPPVRPGELFLERLEDREQHAESADVIFTWGEKREQIAKGGAAAKGELPELSLPYRRVLGECLRTE
jgi:hypothetical protein